MSDARRDIITDQHRDSDAAGTPLEAIMGVVVECTSIIIPRSVVASKYPGGVGGYACEAPNNTFCTDGWITGLGFMVPSDAERFVMDLTSLGFEFWDGEKCVEIAVAQPKYGLMGRCDWCEFAIDPAGYGVAWLQGTSPTPLAHRPGWTIEKSKSIIHIEPGEDVRERMLFLEREGNVEIYLDLKTGQKAYLGRTEDGDW